VYEIRLLGAANEISNGEGHTEQNLLIFVALKNLLFFRKVDLVWAGTDSVWHTLPALFHSLPTHDGE
jgi:hypothetical protein